MDACDVNEQRFTNRISERMKNWPIEDSTIRSEHKADANHRIVGGASIVAKVVRDRFMDSLQEELGFEIEAATHPIQKQFLLYQNSSEMTRFTHKYAGHGRLLNDIGINIKRHLYQNDH